MNECSVDVTNGTVASSCNSCVSLNVPSDPCFLLNETTSEANIDKWALAGHSDSAVVDGVPNKDSTHTSVMISDKQPLSDNG